MRDHLSLLSLRKLRRRVTLPNSEPIFTSMRLQEGEDQFGDVRSEAGEYQRGGVAVLPEAEGGAAEAKDALVVGGETEIGKGHIKHKEVQQVRI